jgi:hypothetical protein
MSSAMEEAERLLVPTLSKAKIASKLSYPIGAEQVSSSLASSAQFNELGLHFYFMFDHDLRRGHYEFLRVEYLNNATPASQWPITSLYKRAPQKRWEVVVQPVPRLLRHAIRCYIIKSALPRIAQWLAERKGLRQRGNDILAFFYDENTEEFVCRQLTRLEPLLD